jgi:hypothetical protein
MSEIHEKKPLPMPRFATEREEADWWYSQRDVLSERFLAAAEAGTLTRGRAARQIAELRAKRAAKAAKEPVQLDPADAQKASELAVRRGVEYDEFVRGLVHDALERELNAAE